MVSTDCELRSASHVFAVLVNFIMELFPMSNISVQFVFALEHVSAEQNRKVPYRIKGFPRGCLWVSLLALILFWRLSDAKFVFCRDARASHRKS